MRTSRSVPEIAALGVVVYALWLVLSGHYTPFLLVIGFVATSLVVYIALRMDLVDDEGVPILHLTAKLWSYLFWLLKEIVVSNLNVTRIILHPGLPISPRIIRFRAIQKTDLGKVIFANSITLTPGTTTLAITRDGDFYVHAIEAEGEVEMPDSEMSLRVTALEKKGS